ncbi:uncharacterized protein LOC126379163 [Pectinophora gossypiella]|uniref:uncharacterized protein LOC126379163 n=1 Tax=Pectinophora gossypiella TaxID=13191 RepID=UPI00214E0E6A|nr:uncharacterized protein LOC126379163 [Pectinophora gossypiella]
MDLKGSLVDTDLRIYPSDKLLKYIQTLSVEDGIPANIQKFIKNKNDLEVKTKQNGVKDVSIKASISLTNKDFENMAKVNLEVEKMDFHKPPTEEPDTAEKVTEINDKTDDEEKSSEPTDKEDEEESEPERNGPKLCTSDLDWLFLHLQKRRIKDKDIPYLHELFEGSDIEMPKNKVIKRNPILEARCVKLRAQQEAREYRKMTKGVDNVRMRFPEDSISYQLKQLNRQLIAIGQFIISIFAGFLFGFKGVEWLVGTLDFGFKLLLGVMCALIIALAEIYFLAKKLNEELNVPETVQLGGPPKFADTKAYDFEPRATVTNKEHQD